MSLNFTEKNDQLITVIHKHCLDSPIKYIDGCTCFMSLHCHIKNFYNVLKKDHNLI